MQERMRVRDFDLHKNLEFKPFFFFYSSKPEANVSWNGQPLRLNFDQRGDELIITSDKKINSQILNRIKYCFGLDEDYSSFYSLAAKDPVLKEFLPQIKGVRIFSAFTDYEAIIGTICSQFTSFPAYKRMMSNIINHYELFPSPEQVSLRILKSAGLGYRAETGIRATKAVMRAEHELLKIKGWGEYSETIYQLFQKRDYSKFYVDSLIKKIVKEHYGQDIQRAKDLLGFAEKKWGAWKGVAEVYLQKFLRDVKA